MGNTSQKQAIIEKKALGGQTLEQIKSDFLNTEEKVRVHIQQVLDQPALLKQKIPLIKSALKKAYTSRLEYFYLSKKVAKILKGESDAEIIQNGEKYRNRMTSFLMLWNSAPEYRATIFEALKDRKGKVADAAKEVAELFENSTIGSNEIADILKKNEGILPADKVYSKDGYYKALLRLLGGFGEGEDQEPFATGTGPSRSEETLLLQELFAAVLHGNNIVNENQSVDFNIYTFNSGSFNLENKLVDGSLGMTAVNNMREGSSERRSKNYFDAAREFYMFLSQQQNITRFKVRPVIDESHPLQRDFVGASLDTILTANNSNIPILFYIPKRDVTFIIWNDYGRASYVIKGDISDKGKLRKIGKEKLKEFQIKKNDLNASSKKPLFLISRGYSEMLKTEFGATQINVYGAYPEKELALANWLERIIGAAGGKVDDTIQTTLGRF